MDAPASAPVAPPARKSRPSLGLALGIVAGCVLAWLCINTPLGPARGRPLILLGGDLGLILLVTGFGLLIGVTVAGAGIAGGSRLRSGLFSLAAALAVWPMAFGNMDDWLALHNPVPGRGTPGPYWKLIPDYLALAALLALAWWAVGRDVSSPRPVAPPKRRAARPTWMQGVSVLATTCLVACLALHVLSGPRAAPTAVGQVYFSVAAAMILGVMAGRSVAPVGLAWYLPVPILVGLIGAVGAAMGPVLRPPYELLNIVPAWGLARPLPIEMVGVGLLAVLWTAPHPVASPPPAK